MTMDLLRKTKAMDIENNRLTYIIPIRSHNSFIKDELMWVEDFHEDNVIVFRCMTGKKHTFDDQQLRQFRLTGR